ncbi:MAG: 2-hydroxyacid dehydrogenase [Burkholderiales bacterium]
MRLLVKSIDDDGRLAPLPTLVTTAWDIVVADPSKPVEFAAALATADAMVSMNWPPDMPPAPRLRLLQLPGAGTDEIAFDALPAATTVCNAYEHEIGIAEYVLAAILRRTVDLDRMDREMRQGRWWGSHLCGPRHGDVYGKTLAIIGYGRIGREVAKRAAAFGMRVIAASRTPRGADAWCEEVAPMSRVTEVVSQADFVLAALPLDATTRGVVDASVLGAMKPAGVIINVGRGATVDEEALYVALRDGRIGGAVIDTWYSYPPQGPDRIPEHAPSRFPFHRLPNVIMTPHASAWTDALRERRCRVIATNLDRLARGEPQINVVRAATLRSTQTA